VTGEQVPAFAESPVPEPGGECDEYDEHDEAAQRVRVRGARGSALKTCSKRHRGKN
jgi:hypothetical protein